MMEAEEAQFCLMSLEEELTCSICLSTFDCPVTIPCGHNFCQDCLLATWKDTYCCPQCRTHFATRPELKKNTVLSTVVNAFKMKSGESEGTRAEKQILIRCDTCLEAEAAKTCLTCMASFCDEHLRPHRENPNFRVHQLSEPLGDMSERICPDHHKLMELFCVQHGRLICSFCLQHVHKGCSFITPEEQRQLKESDLRTKLSLLDVKIEKTEALISQMSDMQNKIKDSAANRKSGLAAEYQQMRDMLGCEEREALNVVDRELDSCQTKLGEFLRRFTENVEKMSKAKENINSLMAQAQTPAFLQTSFDMPPFVKSDPYAPRVNLGSKTVTATQAFAAQLKEHLTEMFKLPAEARLLTLKPELKSVNAATGEQAAPASASNVCSPGSAGPQPQFQTAEPLVQQTQPMFHSPAPPPIQTYQFYMSPPPFHRAPPHRGNQSTPQHKKSDTSHQSSQKNPKPPRENAATMKGACSMEHLSDKTKKDKAKGHPPGEKPKQKPGGHHRKK
ncbi:hypothetical protein LDENG_00028250 [Lucifuga dentata]|nr:hypothetical protein LDENG_00028250 [Lucifuga dentata]